MGRKLALAALLVCLGVSIAGLAQAGSLEITGVFETITMDDFETGESETSHWIVDQQSNRAYRAEFRGRPDHRLTTGAVVRARGHMAGGRFVIDEASGDGLDAGYEVLSAAPEARYEASVAVIIVDFLDSAVSCSPGDIAQRMFPLVGQANVSDYYVESSHGEFGLQMDANDNGSVDVFGPYTVSAVTSDACDYYAWAFEAEALAEMDGVDLSAFRHLMFVLPSNTSCSWWGVANVGCGSQCRSWIARCAVDDLYAHELAHNLGMRHASTDTNNDGNVNSEYGDNSCVMGYSNVGWRHFNAPHKDQMGWFAEHPEQVQTVTAGGVYYLAPLDLHPWEVNYPQIIKIYKPDTNEYYYLSYRMRVGYSSALRTEYTNRLSVHRYRGSGAVRTHLLAVLPDGGRFEDPVNGVTVDQLSHNASLSGGYAAVAVSFGASPQPPTLSLSPDTHIKQAATTAAYAVTLENNDDPSQDPATFELSAALPTGWVGAWSVSSLTLAPGQQGTAELMATPPSESVDGVYGVQVTAASFGGGHPAVSKTAQYVLDASPPDPVVDLEGYQDNQNNVRLSWGLALDGNMVADSYEVWRDSDTGFQKIGHTSNLSFMDSATDVNVDTVFAYYVTAVSVSGHTSIPSNVVDVLVSVKSNSGRGGGGGNGGGNNKDNSDEDDGDDGDDGDDVRPRPGVGNGRNK